MYIESLDDFLILTIENPFNNEIIFQDDNGSFHRGKAFKTFLQERHKINDMASENLLQKL